MTLDSETRGTKVRVKICGADRTATLASRPHHGCPEAIQTFQAIHDSPSPYQPNPPLINLPIANTALTLLPEFAPISLANNVESGLPPVAPCPSRGERHAAQPSSSAARPIVRQGTGILEHPTSLKVLLKRIQPHPHFL